MLHCENVETLIVVSEVVMPVVSSAGTDKMKCGECTNTTCGNDCLATDAKRRSSCSSPDSSPKWPSTWSSLFTKLPSNAGVHSPRVFDNVVHEGAMVHPSEVIQAGIDYYWLDFSWIPNRTIN